MRREDQWEPWVGQRYNHIIENESWPCHSQPFGLEYQTVFYGKVEKTLRVVKCFR